MKRLFKQYLGVFGMMILGTMILTAPASAFWEPGTWSGQNSTGNRTTTQTNPDGSLDTSCDPNPTIWCVYIDSHGNLWLGDGTAGGGTTGGGGYLPQCTSYPVS